ncbi:MBL fold metallo-hydrolase [Patescibacteria group bacterium]|nr:MBL fold metallo-hydrolase [Patescibacteria group bacterium]
MPRVAKVTFCGGAGSVTGANFLLEADGKKILIDCGLTQGVKIADYINWEPFNYDPTEIDMLFVTHAHVDHLGRIPKIINDGFRGKIYSTPPTRAMAGLMLEDTMGILSMSDKFDLDKIYTDENIRKGLSLWGGFGYHEPMQITESLSVQFKNAGHILGSAMVEFT